MKNETNESSARREEDEQSESTTFNQRAHCKTATFVMLHAEKKKIPHASQSKNLQFIMFKRARNAIVVHLCAVS